MTAAGDPFDRLPRSLRARLDAFSGLVDGITIDELQLLAGGRAGEARNAAMTRAQELAARTNRTAALDAIRRVALDYVARRHSQRFEDPRRPFLGGGVSLQSSADERGRTAASFGDALTAIALSDVLDPLDADALLGPWAELEDASRATAR